MPESIPTFDDDFTAVCRRIYLLLKATAKRAKKKYEEDKKDAKATAKYAEASQNFYVYARLVELAVNLDHQVKALKEIVEDLDDDELDEPSEIVEEIDKSRGGWRS